VIPCSTFTNSPSKPLSPFAYLFRALQIAMGRLSSHSLPLTATQKRAKINDRFCGPPLWNSRTTRSEAARQNGSCLALAWHINNFALYLLYTILCTLSISLRQTLVVLLCTLYRYVHCVYLCLVSLPRPCRRSGEDHDVLIEFVFPRLPPAP
jgi:hypothetical protein